MRFLSTRLSPSYRPSLAYRRFLSHGKGTSSNPVRNSAQPSTLSTSAAEPVEKRHTQGRLDRLLNRVPKFMQGHVSSLRSAPVTHITAFLILHEITAVVPLFALAGAFHYCNWLPTYFSEGAWVVAGVEKFGRYFKRKGWISGGEEQEAERLAERGDAKQIEDGKKNITGKWWDRSEGGVRIVVEFATAYAIVKAFLIPRLVISAWGASWFARWTVLPITSGLKKFIGRRKKA